MTNVITKIVSMEIVRRQCGERYFYGDLMAKLVWRLSGVFMPGENMSYYLVF